MTREECLELVIYDRESGKLFWRVRLSNNRVGAEAGSVAKNGYRKLSLRGVEFYTHRIIWLIETGVLPVGQIDHRNTDRSDNRFDNLRLATPSQNNCNHGEFAYAGSAAPAVAAAKAVAGEEALSK